MYPMAVLAVIATGAMEERSTTMHQTQQPSWQTLQQFKHVVSE
jgi:hypothetical protein